MPRPISDRRPKDFLVPVSDLLRFDQQQLNVNGLSSGVPSSHRLGGYSAGAVALIAALVLRWMLDPWLGNAQPLTTMLAAVALAVWLGGYRPALWVVVLGYLACNWAFMEPRGQFSLDNRQFIGMLAYLFSCSIIVGFGEAMRVARRRAKAGQEQTQAAERHLRESEATLRAFYDNSPICMGVTELTGDGDILHVYDNAATCRFFGIEPGSTTNKRALGQLGADPHAVKLWIDRYTAAEATSQPVHFEYGYPTAGGTRFLSATVSAIGPGPSGRMQFCYVAQDVTERKHADAARRQIEDRLRETREVFQAFMDNAPARTWIKDQEGRYVFRNRASEQVIGMAPAEYLGLTDFELFSPASAEQMRANDRLVLDSGQPHRFVETVPIGGEQRKLLAVKFPIVQEGRRLIAGVSLDITEQINAETQLREADRRKDEFLATLAHELRNPLAPIRNAVQLMQTNRLAEQDLAWARDVIERQVRHMARLLDDLLDVSRITTNKLELRKSRVPLASVLQSAVETSRPLIDSAGHELKIELPDETVYVEADLVRLAQVFSNLLNNAAKFTAGGGRIVVNAERRSHEVIVSIKDNGIGIVPEMLPRLFEMFSQASPSMERSQGGLGIGLSLARVLVEMHAGTIEGHSDGLGKGSTFMVRLPVTAAHLPQRLLAEQYEKPAVIKRRLLVVDDLRDAADSLAVLLGTMGHEVYVAYDGEEGVAAAESRRPDAILLDLGMPNLNGYDACRHIRAQPWGKQMFLVALTGWGQEADRRRTEETGFNCHLVKPVDSAALMEVLASLPDSARAA